MLGSVHVLGKMVNVDGFLSRGDESSRKKGLGEETSSAEPWSTFLHHSETFPAEQVGPPG